DYKFLFNKAYGLTFKQDDTYKILFTKLQSAGVDMYYDPPTLGRVVTEAGYAVPNLFGDSLSLYDVAYSLEQSGFPIQVDRQNSVDTIFVEPSTEAVKEFSFGKRYASVDTYMKPIYDSLDGETGGIKTTTLIPLLSLHPEELTQRIK